MKRSVKALALTALSAVVFLGLGSEVFAQKKPALRTASKRAPQVYSVKAGTRIRVRMNESLSSKVSQPGDKFTTTVREPVYAENGAIVIPVGSTIVGRVDTVTKAQKGGNPGAIDVSFIQVELPNGTKRNINGSLTELVSDDAKSDPEGTAKGDKMKNRKIIFIGGGGAGGAVLGAAIGGGKGALIGGLIGAGAGLLGERLTKGEEAEVKSGTEFGVYLNQGVSLPKFAETPDETPTGGGGTYVVQPGDTLGIISRKVYGTSARYMEIYNANRDQLSSPNKVTVGQTLIIP